VDLARNLDGFKVPKSVIVVEALPKTSTGKIQKNVVRSGHASHDGG
jgi:long-chain acyl-CoA synthetase